MPVDPNRRHFATSDELCRYVREATGPTCLLAFSGGKDALACWVQVRRYFERVIPFYQFYVPGLEFVEDNLRYYERAFNTHIVRVPHHSIYQRLWQKRFQSPAQSKLIDGLSMRWDMMRDETRLELRDDLRKEYGCRDAMLAFGMRASDSMRRRMLIKKYGACYASNKRFFPCFDWKDEDVVREVSAAGVKLASDYRVFSRTFEGFKYEQLVAIKRNFPADFERIRLWFPMVDAVLFRVECYEKEGLASCARTAQSVAAANTAQRVEVRARSGGKRRR